MLYNNTYVKQAGAKLCQAQVELCCIPVKLSSSEKAFLRGCLHVSFSSWEVVFLCGCLPVRLSSMSDPFTKNNKA